MLCHQTGQIAAQDYPYVIGRLMDGHRRGPRPVVVLSQKRIVGRPEEGLSSSRGKASHHDEHHESVAQSREHRGHAPEENSSGHNPFPADLVTDIASYRYQNGIEKIEYGRDGTHRHIAQAKVVPDHRKNDVENLSVSLIEKVSDPKDRQNFPFV